MAIRILFFVVLVILLFIPVYKLIKSLFKYGFFIKDENLVNELEKTNQKENQIHKEIETKIDILKKETKELEKVQEGKK